MKIIKRVFVVLIALFSIVLISTGAIVVVDKIGTSYLDDESEISTYLITNVNIVPMAQDTVLTNMELLIEKGLITRISKKIDRQGIEVIDAKGNYLMPGLIDMHVHIWDRYELGLYLSNGVTAIRNLWGMPMHLRIKEDAINGDIISPQFYTTGPKLTGFEFIGDDNLNLSDPLEAKQKVMSYRERGYDFIKTYYGLDKEIFDAIIEQSIISEMDIVSHPSHKVPFSYHTNSQIKSIEHAEEIVQQPLAFDLDTVKMQAIVDSISISNQVNYCPTIIVFNNIYQMMINDSILYSESLKYMNPLIKMTDSKKQFERWYNAKNEDPNTVDRIKNQHDFHLKIVQELHKAGVSLICGTDAGIGVTLPGFSIHQELAFYKEAGLSNFEVLQTATINAAKTHEIMNQMGTIEVGKMANLIIIENNPLEDLSSLKRPITVFVNGRKIDRKSLDYFEEKAKDRNNLIATAIRYVENLIIEKN